MINLFVFGTLRWGGGNDVMLRRDYQEWYGQVEVRGELYYAAYNEGHSTYEAPYPACRFGGESTVVGDLIQIENCAALERVHKMEIGAGYEIQNIKVKLGGSWVDAIGYGWPEDSPVGRRIHSGDYIKSRQTNRMNA